VALARALAIEPRVLLLDEPFGALDAKVRRDLRRWLRELHDRLGLTTVFVTHDQEEALELADRVAILNHGRLEQIGTPAEVYDRPANLFVADFVGDDRGLKRLSLVRVRELRLRQPATARVGESAANVRGKIVRGAFPYVLVVDDQGRPLGCAGPEQLAGAGTVSASGLVPARPLITPDTTLRDALSMLLTAQVIAGVVVDESGRAIGVVTTDEIGDWFRMEAGRIGDRAGTAAGA